MTSEAMSGSTESSELASVTIAKPIRGTGSSESVSMSITELTEDVELSELASLAMADATNLREVCAAQTHKMAVVITGSARDGKDHRARECWDHRARVRWDHWAREQREHRAWDAATRHQQQRIHHTGC